MIQHAHSTEVNTTKNTFECVGAERVTATPGNGRKTSLAGIRNGKTKTMTEQKTCAFSEEPCTAKYCLKGNCIKQENYESACEHADEDEYFCKAYWDGDQWICPIAGTEECDWDCTAPPGAFSQPPGGDQ